MQIKLPFKLKRPQLFLLMLVRYTLLVIVAVLLLFDLYFVYSKVPEITSPEVTTISGQRAVNDTTFNEIINNSIQRMQSPNISVETIIDPFN